MIIIDSDNYAEHGIETMFFPGGEPHVKVPDLNDDILLFLKLRTWNDVGIATMLIDTIDRRHRWFSVFIPYFPGARQDRTDGHSPLTLDVMGRIIGRGVICDMTVFDPHSDQLQMRMNVRTLMPRHLAIPIRDNVAGIIAPDAGAESRATEFRDAFYPDVPLYVCHKKRDFASGKFLGYSMPRPEHRGRYIVVDDICDGGGTFNLLAEEFRKHVEYHHGHYQLELFVSHGIFSRGLSAISPVYDRITTTDSWCRIDDGYRVPGSRLEVIPLLPNLKEHFA